jgi:hypothetical protein
MSIFPEGRSIPLGAETTFILLAPEKIGRQSVRRTIDDIVPTVCLQLGCNPVESSTVTVISLHKLHPLDELPRDFRQLPCLT